jgi:hypothetical protein
MNAGAHLPIADISQARGPLADVPIACSLSHTEGRNQVNRWRAFDADYALSRDEHDGELIMHYAKNADSEMWLAELVAVESECCSFVDRSIDDSDRDLRRMVRGSQDGIAALSIK